MNYPSSKVAVDNMRKFFKIDSDLEQYNKDQEIFQKVYDSKSDLSDRISSSILSAFGAVLTALSISQFFVEGTLAYWILGPAFVLILLGYILYQRSVLKGKEIKLLKRFKKKETDDLDI